MSRYKPLIERNTNDRNELKEIVQNPLSDPDLVIRARAILRMLDGSKGDALSKELGVRPNTISAWRKRYEENGVEGLYDKALKGKRGSATRDEVLRMMKDQTPEGGWTTKELARAVGTSVDTVRRALKDEHLSVSKPHIWDEKITVSPVKMCVDAIGLYLSKEEAGLIIQVDSRFDSQSSPGHITTCNRNLAKSISQMNLIDEDVSLEDAINASMKQMKEVERGNKERFQDFLGRLFTEKSKPSNDYSDRGHFYYVFYWYDDNKKHNPIIQKTGLFVEMTEDVTNWIKMIEPWMNITYRNNSILNNNGNETLLASIELYMGKTTALVEPFEWTKISA